jgi:predicted transcriptional regulator
MTIELPRVVEDELRDLAKKQNRELTEIVEAAVRQYLDAVAITDISPGDVAATQEKLLGELPPVNKWDSNDT